MAHESRVFSLCCLFLHFYLLILCVYTYKCVWKSKDSFVQSVLYFHLYTGSKVELGSTHLQGKPLYVLSHLVSPYMLS